MEKYYTKYIVLLLTYNVHGFLLAVYISFYKVDSTQEAPKSTGLGPRYTREMWPLSTDLSIGIY